MASVFRRDKELKPAEVLIPTQVGEVAYLIARQFFEPPVVVVSDVPTLMLMGVGV